MKRQKYPLSISDHLILFTSPTRLALSSFHARISHFSPSNHDRSYIMKGCSRGPEGGTSWRTRVLGVPHGVTTWMGPGMAHDLLKDMRQGGVDFKLFQIDLVGLLWKLDSLTGLRFFSCNRLGLNTCPYPLPYIKRGTVHPLITLTIIQSIQRKRLYTD